MPDFLYRARDNDGNIVQGTLSTQGRDELIEVLQRRNLMVTYVETLSQSTGAPTLSKQKKIQFKGFKLSFSKSVKLDDLTMFARQMSTLLNAGVPLLRSLTILAKQVESQPLKEAIEGIKKDIQGGSTLKDGLDKHPKIFSKFWVNLVGTGEASGQLPSVLSQIATYFENAGELQRKIVSALIYPAILVGVSVISIFIFVLRIVPIFAEMFKGFNVDLPGPTKAIITLSHFLRTYTLLIIIAIPVVIFLLKKLISTNKGRFIFDGMRLKLPIFGAFFRDIAVATFTRGLGTMIASGVPILYALEIVTKTIGNSVVERAIDTVKDNVREGKTVAEPLEASGIFPQMVVQMISVGEETGELADMLVKVAEFYESRISVLTSRLASMIEPIMLVFMGGIVGFMVVSMFLPIFKLATAVK